MLRPQIRLFAGILFLALMSVVFYVLQFFSNQSIALEQDLSQSQMVMYHAAQEIAQMDEYLKAASASRMENRTNQSVLLMKYVQDMEGFDKTFLRDAPFFLEEGKAFVKVSEGKAELPEGIPEDLVISPSSFTRKRGYFLSDPPGGSEDLSHPYVVYYVEMIKSVYFIEWEAYEDSPLAKVQDEEEETLREIENAFEMRILRFRRENTDGKVHYQLTYFPLFFSALNTAKGDAAQAFGITSDMLSGAVQMDENQALRLDAGGAEKAVQRLTAFGESYDSFFRTLDEGKNVIVFMVPVSDSYGRSVRKTAYLLIVFLVIAAAFLGWSCTVRYLVRIHRLNEEQKNTFAPSVTMRKAGIFLLVGMLVITAFTIFLQCIFASFRMTRVAERCVDSMLRRLESDKECSEAYEKEQTQFYEERVRLVADIYLTVPEEDLPDPEQLRSVCEDIGAEFMVVYDENGRQVLTDSGYRRLTLSNSGDEIYEFQRLLKGAEKVTVKDVKDRITGESHDIFGASVARNRESDEDLKYWALLLFVDPAQVRKGLIIPADELMKSIVFQDTLCFSVDPESGEILSASDPELTGRAAAELGLPKAAMEDAYMGFFRFDGKDVYGKTTREDDVVYIYTVDSSRMYDGLLKVTLSVLCTYLALMGTFALFMLSGYRKEFQQYADTGEVLKEADRVVTPSGKVKRSIDPSRRWGFTYAGYGSRTPAHNAGTAGVVVYVIGMFAVVVLVISGRLREDNSAIAFILRGKWTRGMNLFAIANVLFLFIQISVGTILLKALLRAVTMYLGTKGETIGRLFLSLANYISAIVFVFFTLSYIGIDTTTLVASLGLMTFALSIGAQDLVKDILAGLAIVFDGAYQVGDIIEVNGFRGKVLEVGVRSVKLEGRDGNILIIGNRDVKNVINKTRRNSWYRVEVSVSEGQDLKMIEALLRENLPKIGEKIPEIISGPFYGGIVSIGKGSVTMSIIAECEEEDYYSVQRKLNGAVVELFLSQGISI